MIYEFVTPSDPITFKADNDKIAYACTTFLGNGQAGCTREDGKSLDTMIAFCNCDESWIEKAIKDFLGSDLGEFIEQNREAIAKAFASFSYGRISDRHLYDDAIEAITEPERLEEFKRKHEDRSRSSMSEWVKGAWQYAGILRAEGEKCKV